MIFAKIATSARRHLGSPPRPSATMAGGRALDVTVEVTDAGGLRVLVTPLMPVAHRLRTLAATETLELSGLIVARRAAGKALHFLDVAVDGDGERFQAIVCSADMAPASPVLAPRLQLTTRPGSTVLARGCAGRSRSGEPSLLVREIELLRLPAEPAAVAKAVQLVACGELSEAAAAAALRCEPATLSELSHALEAADGDEQATQFHPAVRACAARLAGRGARHRPAQFSAAERAELAALAADRG